MNKQNFIFSMPQLKDYLTEKNWDIKKILVPRSDVEKGFFILIPKYYIDLIDWYDEKDALKKMVLYSDLEKDIKKYELQDPIADKPFSPVPGIVHRHRDRCLLMLTNICAVHCRFCFRKNLLAASKAHFEESMNYIGDHKELWEVIFSGGDPFMLTDHLLEKTIARLKQIDHVKMIRFHTRTPAVYPQRVTKNLVKILAKAQPLIVVLHINHPREITKEFKQSIKKLKGAGAMLLAQTVLMKDVNDDHKILAELFKKLVEIGVKPYYLHHLDKAAGTHHFRISVEKRKNNHA